VGGGKSQEQDKQQGPFYSKPSEHLFLRSREAVDLSVFFESWSLGG
jgi:hypothetical protein